MKRRKAKHEPTTDGRDGDATGQALETAVGSGAEETPDVAVDPSTGTQEASPGEPQSIESLCAKVASLEDSLLRVKADYQNAQRRQERARMEAIVYANAELMQSLISVVDDLDRAVAAGEGSTDAAVLDGVRLVHDNFLKALRAAGLERIDAMHQPFDPHVHEAMMQQPTDEHPPGLVIEEITKGYRLRDRVLRPAKVIVAKAVDSESPADPNKQTGGDADQKEKEPDAQR